MPQFSPPRFFSRLSAWVVRYRRWLANLWLSLLVAVLGLYSLQNFEQVGPFGADDLAARQEFSMGSLERLSYDLPFLALDSKVLRPLAPRRPTDEVAIVYFDEQTAAALGQSTGPWSRELHARLLDRLTQDGARAVLFDFIFDRDSPDAAVFTEALRKNGRAILGASLKRNSDGATPTDLPPAAEVAPTPAGLRRNEQIGLVTEQVTTHTTALYRSANGWGLLTFRPIDSDYGVRRLFSGKPRDGFAPWPTATWQTARNLGARLPGDDDSDRFALRWVNYYGPSGRIRNYSCQSVLLQDGGVPPGFFKDKVVVIGARSQPGSSASKLLDQFGTPWTRFRGRALAPGAEIHATILLNLMNRDWLGRLPFPAQQWFVVLFGVALGLLRWLRPWAGVITSVSAILLILLAACLMQWHGLVWWNWAVPAFLQVPTAYVFALVSNYYVVERKGRKTKDRFATYLAPEVVQQIVESDQNPQLGGHEEAITAYFSDIQAFSTISEQMSPALLVELMNEYFTACTAAIHQEHGTLDKYVGDSVVAMFGAPANLPDHAYRACLSTLLVQQRIAELQEKLRGEPGKWPEVVHNLRSRQGLNSGLAVIGNTGSRTRFNYTMMGDNVNLASRMESGAKSYGVDIMVTESTRLECQKHGGDRIVFRELDQITVVGRKQPVLVFEIVGFRDQVSGEGFECLELYAKGIECYRTRGWDAAAGFFRQSARLELRQPGVRGVETNPSLVMLGRCAHLKSLPPGDDWDTAFVMKVK